MKPLWGVGPTCALLLLAADAGPVSAAWNNVFQVCCFGCRRQPAAVSSSSYYSGACCNPCPQPCPQVCTTRYVQRCYYQPVTCYQTKSYYEPVTTYRTSYYYEPVTSYRYSCYYDPCTCSYQQVACPTTCYRVRSQCCPVQSWVQRCCQVPVTTYRMSSYWEPVTSCCTPQAPCCPTSAPCASNGSAVLAPSTAAPPVAAPPAVTEQRLTPTPGVQEVPERRNGSGSPLYDRYYPPSTPPSSPSHMPGAEGSSLRPPTPRYLPPAAPPPSVKLERIVSVPQARIQGQVVHSNNAPRPGARLTFVSVEPQGPQQRVTADAAGNFGVTLASGGWLVYVQGADERSVFHSKFDVRDNESRLITLVSR